MKPLPFLILKTGPCEDCFHLHNRQAGWSWSICELEMIPGEVLHWKPLLCGHWKWETQCSLLLHATERVPAVSWWCAEALRLVDEFPYSIVKSLFKLMFSHCIPTWLNPCSYCRLLHHGYMYTLSLSFLFLFGLSLCSSCSVSPQVFFRKNGSVCRCSFNVSRGEGELKVFLHHHLGSVFPQHLYFLEDKLSMY